MEEIAGAAQKYMNHDMIRENTSLPEFPELRTNLLRAFLGTGERLNRDRSLGDAVSLAVSLVQMGLDTHERVESSAKTLTRQMTVLAGDYFSSRFYQLLSQAGNVQSIEMLSESICEVNRMKMVLYSKTKNMRLTVEDYVRSTVDVQTHLFLSFTSWMDEVRRKSWPLLVRTVAECELIACDLSRIRPDNIKNSWAYWHVLQHGAQDEIDALLSGAAGTSAIHAMLKRHRIVPQLADLLDTKLTELKRILQGIGSKRLTEDCIRIAQPLLQFGSKHPALRVLEEI